MAVSLITSLSRPIGLSVQGFSVSAVEAVNNPS